MTKVQNVANSAFKWLKRIVMGIGLLAVILIAFASYSIYTDETSNTKQTEAPKIDDLKTKTAEEQMAEEKQRLALRQQRQAQLIKQHKDWKYHDGRKSIYTIQKFGKDWFGWTNYFMLEVNSSQIIVSALLPRQEYEKDRTLNLPTYLRLHNVDLVPHRDILTYANNGNTENYPITIDGKAMEQALRLDHNNNFQLRFDYLATPELIEALKKGSQLKVTERLVQEVRYPTFSLSGFTKIFETNIAGLPPVETKNYFTWEYLNCHQEGPRKAVWLDTPDGMYALNGPAMDVAEFAKKNGKTIKGKYNHIVKIGRNHIGNDKISALIQVGLKLCD